MEVGSESLESGSTHRRLSSSGRTSPPATEWSDRARFPGPWRGPSGMAGTFFDAGPPDIEVSDHTGSTHSEVSIAAWGDSLLAVWNDGDVLPNGIGYGFSTDGGRTWTDGGAAPLGGGVEVWVADPVLGLDRKTGRFFLSGVVIAHGPANGLAVVEGRFGEQGFQWGTPRLARAARDTLLDKPWIAADSSSGNLYLTYTSFYLKPAGTGKTRGDQIEIQRSTDGNASWSPPLALSEAAEDGLVQGSRPAVGARGEVHVVWKTIDTTAAAGGRDQVRLRSSHDQGRTFTGAVPVARVFTNFTSGAPGFGRGNGLGFPSIAADTGPGAYRGRIYVAWDESLDFYDDLPGTAGSREESEPNDGRADASAFTLGETVRGQVAPAGDADWYRFHAAAGRTVVVLLDSLAPALDVSLRLLCADGETRLAYSKSTIVRPRLVVYTIPVAGDYFVSVTPGGFGSTGGYRLLTGTAERGAERGRDHRDLFIAHSDDGVEWSVPVRIDDDPPMFDDWLAEVAASPDGTVHAAWYDWRDGPVSMCGGVSNVYLSRSYDGGETWRELGSVSRSPTAWTEVGGNLEANQGDYIGLSATERGTFVGWGDGRLGAPDVYMAAWPLAPNVEPLEPDADSRRVRLTWRTRGEVGLAATVYRRTEATDWESRGTITAGADGVLAYEDAAVTPGTHYGYRLGLHLGDVEEPVGEVWVVVPRRSLDLAIDRLQPNPSFGELQVLYVLPDDTPARLQLLDVAGRRLGERVVSGAGQGMIRMNGERALPPGLYWIRLSQSGRSVSAKAIVLRATR